MSSVASSPEKSPSSAASPGAQLRPEHSWGPLGALWVPLSKLPADRVAFAFVLALSASLLLPFLGSVGLYDPWESHYAEVAREMVARDDYVHPHWKDSYFFSKPVLLFWLSAIGFKILDVFTGAVSGPGNMPELTELAARLPIALIAILCVICVYRVTTSFFGRVSGVLSCLVLLTCPFFVLVGRQHITDMPFVGLSTAGLCLMMESFFGDEEKSQAPIHNLLLVVLAAVTLPQYLQICRSTQLLQGETALRYVTFAASAGVIGAACWWLNKHGKDTRAHFFYVFTGLACLAKGLPGILLPGLVFLTYVGFTWEWWRLRRIKVLSGTALWLLVAAPWFVVLSLFTGKDDEQKAFAQRFWVHDHLNRLTGGVHGERGTFEYYIKQLGFGCMPWSGFLPFAWLAMAMPQKKETQDETRTKVRLFVALWALACFGLFSISTTKFHHYILPMVPPLAICAGVFLAELWEEKKNAPLLVILATLLGTIIVGQDLWRTPHQVVDLFTYHYVSYKPDYYFPTDWPYGLAFGVVGGVAVLLTGIGALVSAGPEVRERLAPKATGIQAFFRFIAVEVVEVLLWLGETTGALFVRGKSLLPGRAFVVGICAAGLFSGYFMTGVYFLKLAPHWGQRYLFNTYYKMKQGDEPIIAYLMNWRGESFYSKALDAQINDGNQLKARLKQPGREFILVETSRYKGLEGTLGPEFRGKVNIVDRSSAKWYLVLVDD